MLLISPEDALGAPWGLPNAEAGPGLETNAAAINPSSNSEPNLAPNLVPNSANLAPNAANQAPILAPNIGGNESSFEKVEVPVTNTWPGDYQNNVLGGVYGAQSQGIQQQSFGGIQQMQFPMNQQIPLAGKQQLPYPGKQIPFARKPYGQFQQQQQLNGFGQSQNPFCKFVFCNLIDVGFKLFLFSPKTNIWMIYKKMNFK